MTALPGFRAKTERELEGIRTALKNLPLRTDRSPIWDDLPATAKPDWVTRQQRIDQQNGEAAKTFLSRMGRYVFGKHYSPDTPENLSAELLARSTMAQDKLRRFMALGSTQDQRVRETRSWLPTPYSLAAEDSKTVLHYGPGMTQLQLRQAYDPSHGGPRDYWDLMQPTVEAKDWSRKALSYLSKHRPAFADAPPTKELLPMFQQLPFGRGEQTLQVYELGKRLRKIKDLPDDPIRWSWKGGPVANTTEPLFFSGLPRVSAGYAATTNGLLHQYDRTALQGFYTPHIAQADPKKRLQLLQSVKGTRNSKHPSDGRALNADLDPHYELVAAGRPDLQPQRTWKLTQTGKNLDLPNTQIQRVVRRLPDQIEPAVAPMSDRQQWVDRLARLTGYSRDQLGMAEAAVQNPQVGKLPPVLKYQTRDSR